jgi:hypothetical protein
MKCTGSRVHLKRGSEKKAWAKDYRWKASPVGLSVMPPTTPAHTEGPHGDERPTAEGDRSKRESLILRAWGREGVMSSPVQRTRPGSGLIQGKCPA